MGEGKRGKQLDAFASVALWQLLAFVMLTLFVWCAEILDLPHRFFNEAPSEFSLYRVCIISAAIITAGVIVIGHTYERQRALIKQLLMTCLYCHRVQNEDGDWEHIESYFMRNFPVDIDRGTCPQCQEMLASVNGKTSE